MLFQLVYTSAATRLLSQSALIDLLAVSRANNTPAGITGALVYCDGTFIQALEGPPDAVEATYARIACDPRHRDHTLLLREQVVERHFPDWAMGFRTVQRLPDGVAGFRSAFELTGSQASRAHRMLGVARALDPHMRPDDVASRP